MFFQTETSLARKHFRCLEYSSGFLEVSQWFQCLRWSKFKTGYWLPTSINVLKAPVFICLSLWRSAFPSLWCSLLPVLLCGSAYHPIFYLLIFLINDRFLWYVLFSPLFSQPDVSYVSDSVGKGLNNEQGAVARVFSWKGWPDATRMYHTVMLYTGMCLVIRV